VTAGAAAAGVTVAPVPVHRGRGARASTAVVASLSRAEGSRPRPGGERLPAPGAPVIRHLPGLDGLRAVAVLAVLAYHGGIPWMQGGFLGVDLFFVISGYLITTLLFAEYQRDGRISLKDFWLRRARRLLPALGALGVGVAVFVVVALREEADRLGRELLAAAAYVMNWFLIWTDSSYFADLERPSLLRHLWSLAVEEQFYVVWPLIITVLCAIAYRRPGLMLAVLGGGAVASAVWMAALFDPTGGDPSRAYFGTDTRAHTLLVGAALAVLWRPWRIQVAPIGRNGRALDLVGVAALAVFVLVLVRAGDTDPFLYQGGFLVIAVVGACLVAAVVHPTARIGNRVFAWKPLQWVGQRSYGLYLWHWPVFVMTRPGAEVDWNTPTVVAVRVGLTVALTELSFRLVETPCRRGALGAWWARHGHTDEGRQRRRGVLIGVGTALAVLATPLAVARPTVGETEAAIKEGAEFLRTSTTTAVVVDPAGTSTVAAGIDAPSTTAVDPAAPTTAPLDPAALTTVPVETTAPPPPPPPAPTVTLIGDSVALGAARALVERIPGIWVDALESRAFINGIAAVEALGPQAKLGRKIVLHLGTNGRIRTADFDRMMNLLVGAELVLLVNMKGDRSWQAEVNAVLADGATRYPNAKLMDWNAHAAGNPGWFYRDGIHLTGEGRLAYAEFIAQGLGV
jgi:peptidoglycan/LPS O-acetylase OafA/YrhL